MAKSSASAKRPTKAKPGIRPVPPDAVRVWRGYRLANLTGAAFLGALGGIFIPVTAQLQRLYGLTAYLPTVLPLGKPAGVPDEIALVFYETQQAYNDTKLIVAGRAYSSLHSTVFAFPASESGFPVPLGGELAFDTPYHLFSDAADWQSGFSQVFVGTRKAADSPAKFAGALYAFLRRLAAHRPAGLDGVVVCATADWILYWEHWKNEGDSLKGKISDLPKLAERILLQPSAPTPIDVSLTAHYAGLSVTGGESMNILFSREGEPTS
jgi:hypothetical protein